MSVRHTFTCDFCGDDEAQASESLPHGWAAVRVEYDEPRVWAGMHVCPRCQTQARGRDFWAQVDRVAALQAGAPALPVPVTHIDEIDTADFGGPDRSPPMGVL